MKGAPQIVVAMTRMSEEEISDVLDVIGGYGRRGIRVLAIAKGVMEVEPLPFLRTISLPLRITRRLRVP